MNIFFTIDYELYLGKKTGTPENCLIKPMAALCNAVEEFGVRFIVFVDAAYLLRLKQLKDNHPFLQRDFEIVSKNIKELCRRGHDIQLHFHPQWLYSGWNDTTKEWEMDYVHYKLSDMDETYAFDAFKEAKNLLDSLLPHKTTSFRAGGYCIQQLMNMEELYIKNEVQIDSSVARGMFRLTSSHYYDYRNIPNATIYKFKDNVCEYNPSGPFTELSISNEEIPYFIYLLKWRKITRAYTFKTHWGDGISIGKSIDKRNEMRLPIFRRIFCDINKIASIDGASSALLEEFYRRKKERKESDLVFVGHPKEATDQSVENLREFLLKIHNECEFMTTESII